MDYHSWDWRGYQGVRISKCTMARVAAGPLEVTSAAPVGLTKAPVGLTPDHDNKFIYEWNETFLHNQRFPTPKAFDIKFSFNAPVAGHHYADEKTKS